MNKILLIDDDVDDQLFFKEAIEIINCWNAIPQQTEKLH